MSGDVKPLDAPLGVGTEAEEEKQRRAKRGADQAGEEPCVSLLVVRGVFLIESNVLRGSMQKVSFPALLVS